VVRLALLESLLLALVGGGLGWLAVLALGGAVPRLVPGGLPRAESVAIDATAAIFATAITLLVGLVLGVSGALGAVRVPIDDAVQGGGAVSGRTVIGSRRSRRTRAGLVVAQVALGLALSLSAIGLIESYRRLRRLDLGFEGAGVATISLHLSAGHYPTDATVVAAFSGTVDRISSVPGVAAAGLISDLPLESAGAADDFKIDGLPDPAPGRGRNGRYLIVSPGLFSSLRIPLLQGRLLEPSDGPGAPLVAVINQTLARRYFVDRDPLGQRIRYFSDSDPWLTIVGVVGDVRSIPGQPPEPAVYVSHQQETRRPTNIRRSMALVVRADGDPIGLLAGLRAAVTEAAPGTPIPVLRPLTEIIDAASGSARFAMAVMTGFAVTVVLLAALGIYGLLAHAVSSRQRETGIRMALGADRGRVAGAVVGDGIRLAVLGIGLGVVGSFVAAPAISRLLFKLPAADPAAIGMAAGILLSVAAGASAIPALRAARLDPRASLAQE
jgi:predicted permease